MPCTRPSPRACSSTGPRGWAVPRSSRVGGARGVLVVVGRSCSAASTAAPTIDLDQKPIKASLVRLGKQRDEKLLPRKEEPPPPPQGGEGAARPAPPTPEPVAEAAASAAARREAAASARAAEGRDRRRGPAQAALRRVRQDGQEAARRSWRAPRTATRTATPPRRRASATTALLTAQVRRNYDVSHTIPEAERHAPQGRRWQMRLGARGRGARGRAGRGRRATRCSTPPCWPR